MRNSSVTSAYTQFIQQWKKEDDGEDQKRQATAAITTNKNKIKEELCLMEQQKSSQQHRQLYEQIKDQGWRCMHRLMSAGATGDFEDVTRTYYAFNEKHGYCGCARQND